LPAISFHHLDEAVSTPLAVPRAWLAAAALVTMLAGCGSKSTPASQATPTAGATAASAADSTSLGGRSASPAPTGDPVSGDSSTAQIAPGSGPAHARVVTGGWEIPDPKYTPGAVLTTDAAKVCASGYSKTVRDVSEAEKDQIYAEYGIASHVPYQYEIDHDISLELGGSNDPTNVWPEPNDKSTGNTKDQLEDKLHEMVCANLISLVDAQAAIEGDWTVAYRKYVGPLGTYHSNGLGASASTSGSTSSGSGSPSAGSSGSASTTSTGSTASGGSCAPHTVGECAADTPHPAGATAECSDSTYYDSAAFSGACRGHGGVKYWYR
jgi:hypothetical protein